MKIFNKIKQGKYVSNGFIRDYQEIIRKTAIPYQYQVLNDAVEGVEKSHVVKNFINAGNALKGEDIDDGFYGMVFQDSDAGKWIEAAAYSLANCPDKNLEAEVDALIDIIANAQDEDGYLDTYFTIKDREKRWTDLLEAHELYCAGHMMEAACAYYESTGKDKLLNAMLKNVYHIHKVFIEDGHKGYPGHPEVELALLKMYKLTKDEKCLELAKHFIDVRGVDSDYFENECKNRDWSVWGSDGKDKDYQQSRMPVREMSEAVGHAVRAVYLYTAMAEMAAILDDKELKNSCDRLWDNIVSKKLYVTGGIGSSVLGESFTTNYDLPGDTAYAETCASIGLMFFGANMLEMQLDGKYADIMEQAFYNTVLAGMQLDGKRFFYVNPLEVVPGISAVANTKKHTLTTRPGWYACACCPPNVARLIGSFGKYAYGENETDIFCNMYAAGKVDFDNGMSIECETLYPYSYLVKYKVTKGAGKMNIRIPGWSSDTNIVINGIKENVVCTNGYIELNVKTGDEIALELDGRPYFIYPSTKIPAISGMVALGRGPIVYCYEGVDNDMDVLSLAIKDNIDEVKILDDKIEVSAVRYNTDCSLYSRCKPTAKDTKAYAIPYYKWANRGENEMRVFMPLA